VKLNFLGCALAMLLALNCGQVLAAGEFEKFLEGKSSASAEDKKKAERYFLGTWALAENRLAGKKLPLMPGFFHVPDSHYLFASLTGQAGKADDWFKAPENASYGKWELDIGSVLHISRDIEQQAQTYLAERRNLPVQSRSSKR